MLETFNENLMLSAVQELTTKDEKRKAQIQKLETDVSGIPAIPTPTSGNAGKVITVGSNGKYKLSAIPNEVPTPAVADAGKVIVVNNSGNYELDKTGVVIIDCGNPVTATETNFTFTCPKTTAEIINIYRSGRTVIIQATLGTSTLRRMVNVVGDGFWEAHSVLLNGGTWVYSRAYMNGNNSKTLNIALTIPS